MDSDDDHSQLSEQSSGSAKEVLKPVVTRKVTLDYLMLARDFHIMQHIPSSSSSLPLFKTRFHEQ